MLSPFGETGWNSLTAVTRLRLERAITDDILSGRYDFYGSGLGRTGNLGTWSRTFGRYFTDRAPILQNLLTVLRMGWNGQNYVAEYFLRTLARAATSPEDRERALQALASAYRNDSHVLKNKFTELPEDWREEILKRIEPPE